MKLKWEWFYGQYFDYLEFFLIRLNPGCAQCTQNFGNHYSLIGMGDLEISEGVFQILNNCWMKFYWISLKALK